MTRLKEILICLALGLLCPLLAGAGYIGAKYFVPIAMNVRAASESLPQTMASVKESADTANMVSTQSLDLVGSMTKLVDAVGKTNDKAGQLVDAGTSTVNTVGMDADAMSAKLDAAIDQYATIPPHVNGTLDSVPPFMAEGANTIHGLHTLLADPAMLGAIDNVNRLAGNAATITAHTDAYFFPPPYTGPHPIRHKIKAGLEYGLKLAPGIAGGIAIAKGN